MKRLLRAVSDGITQQSSGKTKATRLLIADFDGTLSPIVRDYRLALPEPGASDALTRLRRAGWSVVLLSGRGLRDLRSRVRARGLVYGGEHGWDWNPPYDRLPGLPAAAERRRTRRLVRSVSAALRKAFRGMPGVRVQTKKYFVVVHHRMMPESQKTAFQKTLARVKRNIGTAQGRWRAGNKIDEFLPQVRWGKGEAARLMIRHFNPVCVIAIGDDSTDEEMFRALPGRGLMFSIHVGRSGATQAGHRLAAPRQVVHFLEHLAHV